MALSCSALLVVLVAALGAAVAHGKNSTLKLHVVDWNIAHALDALGTVVDSAESYYKTFHDSKVAQGPLRACVTDSHAAVQDTHNAKKTLDIIAFTPVRKQVPILEKVQIYVASCLVYLEDCENILNSTYDDLNDDEVVAYNVILDQIVDPMTSLQLALNAIPDRIQRKCIWY